MPVPVLHPTVLPGVSKPSNTTGVPHLAITSVAYPNDNGPPGIIVGGINP